VALTFAAALLHETVIVEARQQWNRRRDGDANIRFREGSFWYRRGTRIYRVAEADRESRTLREVRIFERNERGQLLRSIAADRIEILDAEHWLFVDAVFRDFDPSDREALPRIERAERRVVEIADPRDRALMGADPAALPLARLREFIEAKEARGSSAVVQRTLLYGRLGDWASIALLVTAAIPLGLSVERTRSLGRSSGYATAAIVGFYTLRNLGSVLSVQGLVAPGTAAVGLLAALGLLAAVGWLRTPR
jgi:lipopolysaccharide export LptBFGC system permease protein LptF